MGTVVLLWKVCLIAFIACRYFLYLGRTILDFIKHEGVTDEYKAHCITAFNKRWAEIDDPYMRLAFYLHPSCRAYAVRALPLKPLYTTVSTPSTKFTESLVL